MILLNCLWEMNEMEETRMSPKVFGVTVDLGNGGGIMDSGIRSYIGF